MNKIIKNNMGFLWTAVKNTRAHAAVKFADGEITKQDYDDVVEYCEDMLSTLYEIREEYKGNGEV